MSSHRKMWWINRDQGRKICQAHGAVEITVNNHETPSCFCPALRKDSAFKRWNGITFLECVSSHFSHKNGRIPLLGWRIKEGCRISWIKAEEEHWGSLKRRGPESPHVRLKSWNPSHVAEQDVGVGVVFHQAVETAHGSVWARQMCLRKCKTGDTYVSPFTVLSVRIMLLIAKSKTHRINSPIIKKEKVLNRYC